MGRGKGVRVGDRAPDFELPSHRGGTVRLSDFRGKKTIVLYFYPHDHTPGCTAEAQAFRDQYPQFKGGGAEVLGVSGDSIASHLKFAETLGLPFTLLADEGDRVRELYGVGKTLGIIPGRMTFVIDREGIVRLAFSSQLEATRHVAEALRAIGALEGRSAGRQVAKSGPSDVAGR